MSEPSKRVCHLETVLGADVMVWTDGTTTICRWDDATAADSPAGRDLARAVGVDP